jgi:endonuclease YncB( thermonuclease family)
MKKGFIMTCSLIAFMYSVQSWASEIRIIDADTIELNGAKVRFSGIDAPEMGQKCEDIDFKMYHCGVIG